MRKTSILAGLLMVVLAFSGCSKQNVTIDVKALADDLVSEIPFQVKLEQVDESIVKMLYDIDDFVTAYVYLSSGATAEEVAVFEFEDEDSAKQAIENVNARIDSQRDGFALYIPDEVTRLNNAVVEQSGNYLAMCVSAGNEAAGIISEYFK